MDKTVIAFLVLVIVLIIGNFIYNEAFFDASGAQVTISLSDLISMITNKSSYSNGPRNPSYDHNYPSYDPSYGPYHMNHQYDPSDSYNRYDKPTCPSKNTCSKCDPPSDYIRKDSIPCYGCSL